MNGIKFSLAIVFFLFFHQLVFSQNTVCFTIEANINNGLAFSGFTKFVNVLDCFEVYAEPTISDSKVLHAAAVAAELLDNDEDGIVDDINLKNELSSSGALIPIFSFDGSSAEQTFFNNYNGNGAAAVLYNNEMDPSQTGYWGADATVEEVIHVINAVGHTSIYPNAFDISPNSSLMSAAMDVARGGQFLTVPSNYPPSAWYHYDDVTCDYGCMAIEYMYWSIVSLMGILNDPATCAGIANEWEPCSPTLFQSTDTLMYALITDPQYMLPTLAPDGNYCPQGMNIVFNNENDFLLYPNPGNGDFKFTQPLNQSISYKLFTIAGELLQINTLNKSTQSIDLQYLKNGIYTIKINNKFFQKLVISK